MRLEPSLTRWSLLFSLLFLSLPEAFATFTVPRLTGPVIDHGNFLNRNTENKLARALSELKRSGGSQVQILTVKSLNGQSIEQASIKVTDTWELGSAKEDNGVLLLISKKERKIRIEVGQGLEGQLTDAHSKRIISEVMVPLFRSGNSEGGILLGTVNIVKKTDPSFPFESYFDRKSFRSTPETTKEQSFISRLISFAIFFFMLILFIKNPTLFFLLLASSGRGRGGFGRGGSRGGWSGGGGGFSGGGASGGW